MRQQSMTGGSAAILSALSLTALTLTGPVPASAADQVTETIEGDQLIIESTIAPELFTAVAPDDLLEWDVNITTKDSAENIYAELQSEGSIPVEAAVYSCERAPNETSNTDQAGSCVGRTEIQPASRVPRDGTSTRRFEVPEDQQLRILLHLGSFDPQASGRIFLQVTAHGEHLEVEPPSDHIAPSPADDQEASDPAGEAPSPTGSVAEDEQRQALASTGTTVGAMIAAALLFLGLGTYLRRRKTSSPRSYRDN